MQNPPLVHHVFFWLKNSGSAADRAKLIAGLETLRAIPTIKEFYIGVPAATEVRGAVDATWDVSELMVFETLEDEAAYQPHPIHVAFIAAHEHLWDKVVVYDVSPA